MSDFFTSSVLVATFASMIRLVTPYPLVSIVKPSDNEAVLNLGVDGVMLLSAFSYWTAWTGNLWLAVVVA